MQYTLDEILGKIKEWHEIASEIPSSDVCEVSDIANDLAWDMQRVIDSMED